jgi:hypothetical protein
MESKISRQMLLWIFVWFTILGMVIAYLGHLEMGTEKSMLLDYLGVSPEGLARVVNIEHLYWGALAVILAVTGLVLWLSLRVSVKRVVAHSERTAADATLGEQQKKTPAPKVRGKKTSAQDDQRRALHLLCLLQREGRLVDFLEEDLKSYDDAQIGAAVRSIQETCQKSLNDYLDLKAVIDQEEGEAVTIQAGFDANAIKLTGNITGEPPFKGMLQHRGWQISNFSLPALSGTQNPNIVAPAEVEIS